MRLPIKNSHDYDTKKSSSYVSKNLSDTSYSGIQSVNDIDDNDDDDSSSGSEYWSDGGSSAATSNTASTTSFSVQYVSPRVAGGRAIIEQNQYQQTDDDVQKLTKFITKLKSQAKSSVNNKKSLVSAAASITSSKKNISDNYAPPKITKTQSTTTESNLPPPPRLLATVSSTSSSHHHGPIISQSQLFNRYHSTKSIGSQSSQQQQQQQQQVQQVQQHTTDTSTKKKNNRNHGGNNNATTKKSVQTGTSGDDNLSVFHCKYTAMIRNRNNNNNRDDENESFFQWKQQQQKQQQQKAIVALMKKGSSATAVDVVDDDNGYYDKIGGRRQGRHIIERRRSGGNAIDGAESTGMESESTTNVLVTTLFGMFDKNKTKEGQRQQETVIASSNDSNLNENSYDDDDDDEERDEEENDDDAEDHDDDESRQTYEDDEDKSRQRNGSGVGVDKQRNYIVERTSGRLYDSILRSRSSAVSDSVYERDSDNVDDPNGVYRKSKIVLTNSNNVVPTTASAAASAAARTANIIKSDSSSSGILNSSLSSRTMSYVTTNQQQQNNILASRNRTLSPVRNTITNDVKQHHGTNHNQVVKITIVDVDPVLSSRYSRSSSSSMPTVNQNGKTITTLTLGDDELEEEGIEHGLETVYIGTESNFQHQYKLLEKEQDANTLLFVNSLSMTSDKKVRKNPLNRLDESYNYASTTSTTITDKEEELDQNSIVDQPIERSISKSSSINRKMVRNNSSSFDNHTSMDDPISLDNKNQDEDGIGNKTCLSTKFPKLLCAPLNKSKKTSKRKSKRRMMMMMMMRRNKKDIDILDVVNEEENDNEGDGNDEEEGQEVVHRNKDSLPAPKENNNKKDTTDEDATTTTNNSIADEGGMPNTRMAMDSNNANENGKRNCFPSISSMKPILLKKSHNNNRNINSVNDNADERDNDERRDAADIDTIREERDTFEVVPVIREEDDTNYGKFQNRFRFPRCISRKDNTSEEVVVVDSDNYHEEKHGKPSFPLKIGKVYGRNNRQQQGEPGANQSSIHNIEATQVVVEAEDMNSEGYGDVEFVVHQQSSSVSPNQSSARLNGTITKSLLNKSKHKHYDLDTGKTYETSDGSSIAIEDDDNKATTMMQQQSSSQYSAVRTPGNNNLIVNIERPKESPSHRSSNSMIKPFTSCLGREHIQESTHQNSKISTRQQRNVTFNDSALPNSSSIKYVTPTTTSTQSHQRNVAINGPSTTTTSKMSETDRDLGFYRSNGSVLSNEQLAYQQNQQQQPQLDHKPDRRGSSSQFSTTTENVKTEYSYDDIEKSRMSSSKEEEQLGLRLPAPTPTISRLPVTKKYQATNTRTASASPSPSIHRNYTSSSNRSDHIQQTRSTSRHHSHFAPIDYSMIRSVITDSDDERLTDNFTISSDEDEKDSIDLFGERSVLMSLPSLDST